jgi:glucose-1-phosphate cytidylyltransferase
VNLKELYDFHMKNKFTGTLTGVYPPSRFGDLVTEGEKVTHFYEKVKDENKQEPINGGYFVFKKEFLDMIPDDPSIDMERMPMTKLTEQGQLAVFRHNDFWQCMDNIRDLRYLRELWNEGKAPWKLWED